MKDYIIGKLMDFILKFENYDEIKKEEIKYGLTSIYLLITKLLVIIILAIILNIEKEVLLFILAYNGIRLFSFGLHATKSSHCLISSIIIFIFLPFVCKHLFLNMIFKSLFGIICILLIFKNSPADTHKRPIINKKRRIVYKYMSTIISIIYTFISLFSTNLLSNCLLFSLILQCFIISPTIYKLFKLPYNNYLNYTGLN